MDLTIDDKNPRTSGDSMRVLIVLMFVALSLSGCVSTTDGDPDFQRTCPVFHQSPDHPKWRNEAMVHDPNGQTEEVRRTEDLDKWLIKPGVQGGFNFRDGVLDYVDLDFKLDALVNATITFTAYRASASESPVTEAGEEPVPPTGPRLRFRDMLAPGTPYVDQIVIGPAVGPDKDDWILNVTGKYRVEFTDGTGAANPSPLRIDAFFEVAEQEGGTRPALAFFEFTADFWFRHNDCIS